MNFSLRWLVAGRIAGHPHGLSGRDDDFGHAGFPRFFSGSQSELKNTKNADRSNS
jgi:hypothetical protein